MELLHVLLATVLFGTKSTSGVSVLQKRPEVFTRTGTESVTLHCEHDDADYYRMFWYRQDRGRGMRMIAYSGGQGDATIEPPFSASKYAMERPEVKKSSLQIKDLAAGDSAVYFCASTESYSEAHFGSGTKLTVLEPNIKITRPTVKVLPPSNLEDCKKKKKKLTLVCVATGFYPDHITVFWKLNGANLTSGVRTDDTALRNGSDGFYSITSRLRVPSKKWFDTRNSFTCLTSFYDGDSYLEDEDSIKGVNGGGMDREYFLKSGVTAKLSYSLFIAKSFLYGLFISAVVWKIRSSAAKHYE